MPNIQSLPRRQHAASFLSFAIGALLLISLHGCGTLSQRVDSGGGLAGASSSGGLLGTRTIGGASRSPSSGDVEIAGVALTNTDFDIPVAYNREVERWVEHFTGPGRKHFKIYLERMEKLIPVIHPRLDAAGAPRDLIYLAMVESGFSPYAKSWVGAMGTWQFMRSTGRMYGLDSDWWHDERRDPKKSTDSAIKFLMQLHNQFGEWELAMAAYNGGPGRIGNAVRRVGTNDFWRIARDRKALRKETKDYVPRIMAAAIISKNAEQFGFRTPEPDRFWLNTTYVEIPRVESLKNIALVSGIEKDTLMELNPEILRCCTPPVSGSYSLRVPKGEGAEALIAAVKAGEVGRYADFRRYKIRRGDSLFRIARSHGVPVQAILSLNEVNHRALKPGAEILIPSGGSALDPGRKIASSRGKKIAQQPAKSSRKRVTHVVRRGDTITSLSERYSVSVDEVRDALGGGKKLRPGSRIKLYVRNDENI